MSPLEPLLASYLDLQEQKIELDPNDPVWLQARLAALRSIAHAAEDLDCEALDDEVDRTMLIDTIRFDMNDILQVVKPTTPEAVAEMHLAALTSEPHGVRGTLRMLELRRAGIERSLGTTAGVLGWDNPLAAVDSLRDEVQDQSEPGENAWREEWERCGAFMMSIGLPAVLDDAPPLPPMARDEWSYPALAARGHAVLMLEAARAAQRRAVRQRLLAPGLLAGWGRTVAALLRDSPIFAMPERRLMMSHRALVESLAAEADLQLQAGLLSETELLAWVHARAGGTEEEASAVIGRVTGSPFTALAAALSHEAWQAWYADEGGDAASFLNRALRSGGLSVRLARWAATAQQIS